MNLHRTTWMEVQITWLHVWQSGVEWPKSWNKYDSSLFEIVTPYQVFSWMCFLINIIYIWYIIINIIYIWFSQRESKLTFVYLVFKNLGKICWDNWCWESSEGIERLPDVCRNCLSILPGHAWAMESLPFSSQIKKGYWWLLYLQETL